MHYEDLIADSFAFKLPASVKRDVSLKHKDGFANVVIGMRRVGKTHLLYQKMQELLDRGIPRNHILYINFEDDRLYPLSETILNDILEAFYKITPSVRKEGAFIFFDEIQAIPNWGRFCRRLLDTETVELYITGSSSKMLSSEVATEFRGRSRETHVLPLSFREYLRFLGKEPSTSNYSADTRSFLKKAFEDYLVIGGFPGIQGEAIEDRISVLQSYFDTVLTRDIMERHSYSNYRAVRYFAREAIRKSACEFSVNKTYNTMKSLGLTMAKNSLYTLKDDLIDAFAFYEVQIFLASEAKRSQHQSKVYSSDPGLTLALSHASQDNLGQRFETAVFLELLRRTQAKRLGEISYYSESGSFEIDFVVGDALDEEPYSLFQASAYLDSETVRTREYRGANKAMEKFGFAECSLITLEDEETLELDQGTLYIRPAWRWFLE